MKYNKKFEKIIEKLSHIDHKNCPTIKQDIHSLSDLYNKKNERLDKIIKQSDKQQMAILKLNEEIDDYKKNLETKVAEEIHKREQQENLLIEQSRLASIATIIDAVAHQWIQPLNILSMHIELLKLEAKKNNGVSPKIVNAFKENSFAQIQHLNVTLNNFRQFFRPIDKLQPFSVYKALQSVLALIEDELVKYAIKIDVDAEEDFTIMGNENEFKHILLNLLNNSKYAFLHNSIQKRVIRIIISKQDKKIDVIDNAGGIDKEILNDIFTMNVTNKGDKGTGIGLYLSSQIAKKHKGKLFAKNIKNGAKFTFKLED